VQPVFDAVGQKTMWLGDAGAGTDLLDQCTGQGEAGGTG